MSDPRAIGRYEILSRIGAGGMGELFLGRDPNISRLVAIKLLLKAELDHPEVRSRFAREARAGGALSHPNIVTVFDYGEFEGAPFLVMEYIRGETVREIIRRRGSYSVAEKVVWLEQLCDGLAYAHDAGVIHRDIKPANLMIDTQQVLKILDFGLARTLEPGLTVGHGPIGTPGYMSPEQIEGKRLDRRTDLFAAGVVAYELLTGTTAFPGDSSRKIMHRVLHDDPTPHLLEADDLSPALVAIVQRALQKNPANRFPTAAAMRDALRRVRRDLAPRTTTVSPPAGASPTAESPRRPPDTVADAQAMDVRRRLHRQAEAVRVNDLLAHAEDDLRHNRLAEAEQWIARALVIQPDSVAAAALGANLDARRRELKNRDSREHRVKAACDRARLYLRAGANEAAYRAFQEALALDPNHEQTIALREALMVPGDASTATALSRPPDPPPPQAAVPPEAGALGRAWRRVAAMWSRRGT